MPTLGGNNHAKIVYIRIIWKSTFKINFVSFQFSEEICIQEYIGAGLRGIDFSNLGDAELQNLLNNMSQQQLMQVRSFYQTVKTGVMV